MKIALEIQTKGGKVIFQAHELLEIAIQIMQIKWKEAIRTPFSRKLHIATTDEGKHHLPRKLADFSSQEEAIISWLAVAANLKQGASNAVKKESKIKNEQHMDELQLNLVEYYRDKLEELEHLTINPLTKPIWHFWEAKINEVVEHLSNSVDTKKYEADLLTQAIILTGSYLDLFKLVGERELSPTIKAFIEAILHVYEEKCSESAHQDCLTYIRCLIPSVSSSENNSSTTLFSQYAAALIGELDLNLESEVSAQDLCYFVAQLRSASGDNMSLSTLKIEINSTEISELKIKSTLYQSEEKYKHAKALVVKRCDLYNRYNQVLFLKKLIDLNKFLEFKKTKSSVGHLWKSVELLSKCNSTHHASDYYMILRLFVRNGMEISSIKQELFESFLKRVKRAELSCDDFCTATQGIEKKLADKKLTPAEHIHDPQIDFYSIGERVIGINQHYASKGRYVYDYGQNTEILTQEYLACADIEKTLLTEIDDYAKKCVDCNIFIDRFLTFYEGVFLKEISFDEEETVSINRLKIPCHDLDAIKQALEASSKIFKTEVLKIEYIHKMVKIYIIEHLCFQKRFSLQMRQERKYDIDTLRCHDIVTYPQIFRALPEKKPVTTIATSMRNLLKGEARLNNSSKAIGILTATWFLAETSRNPLTFLITLMMLDIAESGYPYNSDMSSKKTYTWKNILWSPETIEIKDADERRSRFPQEEAEGGKHPMCHIDSYSRYFQNDQWPLSDELELVRQKEATILINWLKIAITQYCPHVKAVVYLSINKERREQFSKENLTFYSYKVNRLHSADNATLKMRIVRTILEPLLVERLKHFNNLLSQTLAPTAITLPETELLILEHKVNFLFFRQSDEYIYAHRHENQREFDQRFGLMVKNP